MKLERSKIGLVLMLSLLVAVFACERNVTTVEEVTKTGVLAAENCFVCHGDEDTRIVAAAGQWANSQHATGENQRGSSTCAPCHTSEGFVEYHTTGTSISVDSPTMIHCFTCHAPHTNRNFTLRVTDEQELQNGDSYDLGEANICVACHQSRRNVDTYISKSEELSQHWGPHHSPQGDMLVGTNGYEFDDYDYGNTNHRSATANGCLDCHFEVSNSAFLGGHSFNMEHNDEYNVDACAECHSDMEDAEDFNRPYLGGAGIQDQVRTLTAQLFDRFVTAGLLVYYAEDDAWEPAEDRVTTADSAGALWNYLIAEEDQSHGVHNPRYTLDLLISALEFLGVPPASQPPTAEAQSRNDQYSRR